MPQSHIGKKLNSHTVSFKVGVAGWYGGEGMRSVIHIAMKYEWIEKEWEYGTMAMIIFFDFNLGKTRRLHSGGYVCSQQQHSDIWKESTPKAWSLERAEVIGLQSFCASQDMWLSGWKLRGNVGIRKGTNTPQKIPDDYTDISDQLLNGTGNSMAITKSEKISNNVQVSVASSWTSWTTSSSLIFTTTRFDSVPSATNNVRGQRTVSILSLEPRRKGLRQLSVLWLVVQSSSSHFFKEKNGEVEIHVSAALKPPENADNM